MGMRKGGVDCFRRIDCLFQRAIHCIVYYCFVTLISGLQVIVPAIICSVWAAGRVAVLNAAVIY